MATIYYDKTDKGREEISSRKYQLPSKLRPLLVMIDGKHGSDELLKRLAAIGLTQENLEELLRLGFIAPVQVSVPAPVELARKDTPQVVEDTKPETKEPTKEITPAEKIANLRQFFTETIKGNLGLRGFTLQLKVERAETLEDFISLSEDYVEALYKAKGQQIARNLEARLQDLIDDAR
jgi:hypothetical protein